MGQLEKLSKKRARRGQLERAALTALALAGVAGLMIAAPNTLQLLKHVDTDWLENSDPTRRLRNVARRLQKKKYIEWVKTNGRVRMQITPLGKQYLDRAILSGGPLPRPLRWDGKWRLVIFDIPEAEKKLRDKVRRIVSGFGFTLLQNSVWVYPYDCEEVITLLKNDLSIGKDMLYVIADAIEYDIPLRDHFGLRKP